MSLEEKKFDVIIVGTESQREKAVELLNSHGIRACYIPLNPASTATFICQKWHNIPYEQDEQSELELVLQQHSFQTNHGETITYTMQVQTMEQEVEEEQEELTFIEVSPEEAWSNDADQEELEELSAKFELGEESAEIVEDEEKIAEEKEIKAEEQEMEEETETAEHDALSSSQFQATSVPFYSPSDLLAGKSLLWEQERSLHRRPSVNLLQGSLLGQQVFKIKEDEKQETNPSLLEEKPEGSEESVQQEQDNPNPDQTITAELSNNEVPASEIQAEKNTVKSTPLFERELRLRKRLLSSNYRMRHRIQQSLLNARETNEQKEETEKQEEVQEPNPKETYPVQPLSMRRRSRVHKKNRLLSNLELARKTPEPQPAEPEPEQSFLRKDEPMFESDFAADLVDDDYQETQGTEPLKRDTIEFEEPFGNNWEDFLHPYPQGNRKRQELDKIEKRKIALRGLHNLINQLG